MDSRSRMQYLDLLVGWLEHWVAEITEVGAESMEA
jgi:hypothetical protein